MNDPDLRPVLESLLDAARLTPQQVVSRLEEARNEQFWRLLNPALSIGASSVLTCDREVVSPAQSENAYRSLIQTGYFQIGPVLSASLIRRMRECVETLESRRWPPVFSYVYDEFWEIVRYPSILEFIERFLGSGFKQNAAIWTYRVTPVRGCAGWPPHVDGGDGQVRLTIWIPLSDATVDNGCIYVLPRDRVPDSLPADYHQWQEIPHRQMAAMLHGIRALPAQAGSILGWDHQLIHWGSVVKEHGEARISIALEFNGPQTPLRTIDAPLTAPDTLPSFPQRLEMIGRALCAYAKFEPLMLRYRELAERLAAG